MLLCAASAIAAPAHAQCPPQALRWQDDCKPIDGKSDGLRAIVLDADASAYLSLGGEYRIRTEAFDRPLFGLATQHDYLAIDQRILAHADLRIGTWRAFLQIATAESMGRPARRRVDQSAPDVQQAFVDVPIEGRAIILRLGRQELDGEGDRLISLRDAGNLRRTFDMAMLDAHWGNGWRLRVFTGRPVLENSGVLDDVADPAERFSGMIVGAAFAPFGGTATWRAFWLRRERDRVIYADGDARDDRTTLGARIAGQAGSTRYAVEIAVQRGRFGDEAIRAFGATAELFRTLKIGATKVRIGAATGFASGDRGRSDRAQGTFDVLYPNLNYFTDAPGVYPGNTIDLSPQVQVAASAKLSLEMGLERVWRVTTQDALFTSGGAIVANSTGNGGRVIATEPFTRITWMPRQSIQLTTAYVRGHPGSAFQGSNAVDANYFFTSISLRY